MRRCLVLLSLLAGCAQVRGDTGGAPNAIAITINPFCHVLCFGYGREKRDTEPGYQPK